MWVAGIVRWLEVRGGAGVGGRVAGRRGTQRRELAVVGDDWGGHDWGVVVHALRLQLLLMV